MREGLRDRDLKLAYTQLYQIANYLDEYTKVAQPYADEIFDTSERLRDVALEYLRISHLVKDAA